MNKNLIIILLISSLFISCSGKTGKYEKSRIRFFNATEREIEFKLSSNSAETINFNTAAFSDSSYRPLQPSVYDLEIWSGSKILLKRKLALAKDEKYTLVFYGRPRLSDTMNQARFSYKMHRVFEGEENNSKNGYLPGYKVFSDQVHLKKSYSRVRVLNAASGFSPISIKLDENGNKKKLVSGLAYPKPMQGKTIKGGNRPVELYLSSAPNPVLYKNYDFRSGRVYTIVVFHKDQKLDFKILSTKGT
ncbi:hypothetical protein [Salegentibacter chungangensis]|uniref:DUF4397 domain-containing protein n=1 Tax=Salegentibacter chungangensis TaxID=1335724 RepID=A0ABW3NSB4_9FLAO